MIVAHQLRLALLPALAAAIAAPNGFAAQPSPAWMTFERIKLVTSNPNDLGVTFSTEQVYLYGFGGKRPVPVRLTALAPSRTIASADVSGTVTCTNANSGAVDFGAPAKTESQDFHFVLLPGRAKLLPATLLKDPSAQCAWTFDVVGTATRTGATHRLTLEVATFTRERDALIRQALGGVDFVYYDREECTLTRTATSRSRECRPLGQ